MNNKRNFDTDLDRNIPHSAYMDVSTQPPSVFMSLWGAYMGDSNVLLCSTGQLGNHGGNAWRRLQQRPRAPEAGELHAEEEEMAVEGLA